MRKNLIWCSVDFNKILPTWIADADDQSFDLILHNYGDTTPDYVKNNIIAAPHEEKLNVAGKSISAEILSKYDQFAFLDDDLDITIEDLNRLFQVGEVLRLALYQPALTRKSYNSHLHLQQIPDAVIRKVPFVEIMCPFFSRAALTACLPTFDLNLSGWGLDCFVWPRKVNGECYVIDAIPIGHYNTPNRRQRVMANGKTPQQECAELQKEISKYT